MPFGSFAVSDRDPHYKRGARRLKVIARRLLRRLSEVGQ
jgi:hypothetical protein